MSAEFNKSVNILYFALQFPHVQKIHLNCTIKNTVSFKELQKITQITHIILQKDKRNRNTNYIKILQSLKHASSSLIDILISIYSSQSSININIASFILSLDAQIRVKDLIIIKKTKIIIIRLK